ncbi:hypothetical protein M9Y10_036347, partial [Tritrichomonas musculus]
MLFLPPHLSHVTQLQDLLIFHPHKDKFRELCNDTDGEIITDKILDLYSTFQSVVNVKNIKSFKKRFIYIYMYKDKRFLFFITIEEAVPVPSTLKCIEVFGENDGPLINQQLLQTEFRPASSFKEQLDFIRKLPT